MVEVVRKYLVSIGVALISLCLLPVFSTGALAAEDARWDVNRVISLALANRQELVAKREALAAARERPAMASALEDPMLSPAIDHYPFDMMKDPAPAEPGMDDPQPTAMSPQEKQYGRYDWSVAVEQRFPFSGVLSHKRDSARAGISKVSAEANVTALDIALEAVSAFYMLNEKRRMMEVNARQIDLARQLVSATGARYGSGTGSQADVLRVEVELSRLEAESRTLQAQIRSAEAMFNTNLGRAAEEAVPSLSLPDLAMQVPPIDAVIAAALQQRPELRMGSAEVEQASAEIRVMQDMYAPMGMLRVGYASTMAEGKGAMLMVGVSLPIWREKLSSGVKEARAMHRMAQADLEAMRRMVRGEAIATREELSAARIRYLNLRDDVVPRAERLIYPALSTYSSGQGSLVSVIEAAQALWDVQAEAIMAETSLGVAWARFNRVIAEKEDTQK